AGAGPDRERPVRSRLPAARGALRIAFRSADQWDAVEPRGEHGLLCRRIAPVSDARYRAGTGQRFRRSRSRAKAIRASGVARRDCSRRADCAERAQRAFADLAAARGIDHAADAQADFQLVRDAERLLASAIGAPSARLVLALALERRNLGLDAAMGLLDDATAA